MVAAESPRYELIVGSANQLADDDTRYTFRVNMEYKNWLKSVIKVKSGDKGRKISIKEENEYTGFEQIYMLKAKLKSGEKVYLKMGLDTKNYPGKSLKNIKVYDGNYTKASQLNNQKDITSKILGNGLGIGTVENNNIFYSNKMLTFAVCNNSGKAIGLLNVHCYVENNSYIIGDDIVSDNENQTYTTYLDSEYDKNGVYKRELAVCSAKKTEAVSYQIYCTSSAERAKKANERIVAVYKGIYNSKAQAQKAGAKEITAAILGKNGLKIAWNKNYSYTVFYKDTDGTIAADKHTVKFIFQKTLSNEGYFQWQDQMYDESGEINAVSYTSSRYGEDDSYGDNNFTTYLVDESVDLKALTPSFYYDETSNSCKVYANVNKQTVEIPKGQYTPIDFSKGPVQFTVRMKNSKSGGSTSKNYWITVKKPVKGSEIYINSLSDSTAKTKEKNGLTTTSREVILDSRYNNKHDVLLVNMGTEDITDLKARLELNDELSNVITLNAYWSLDGKYDLKGFQDIQTLQKNFNASRQWSSYGGSFGETEENAQDTGTNIAKLQLEYDSSAAARLDDNTISGTLIISSGNKDLMKIKLSGMVGEPKITTKKVPDGVKYVPYGTLIQNSNKYDWNEPTYKITKGKLPAGFTLDKNTGEIYGMPKKVGTYKFEVTMKNNGDGLSSSSKKTYKFKIKKNTDKNVNRATDKGYELLDRIDKKVNGKKNQTLRSKGSFDQFEHKVFLDGEELKEGRDYKASEGSTKLLISKQVLKQSGGDNEKHTLALQFNASENKNEPRTLKVAAQNFVYKSTQTQTATNTDTVPSTTPSLPVETPSITPSQPAETPNTTPSQPTETLNSVPNQPAANNIIMPYPSAYQPTKVLQNSVQYTVQYGDSLYTIALRYYGNGNLWTKIYDANRDRIFNPRLIFPGMNITVPASV